MTKTHRTHTTPREVATEFVRSGRPDSDLRSYAHGAWQVLDVGQRKCFEDFNDFLTCVENHRDWLGWWDHRSKT